MLRKRRVNDGYIEEKKVLFSDKLVDKNEF